VKPVSVARTAGQFVEPIYGNTLAVTVIGMQTRRMWEPARGGERRMASYLLMPRPKDLVKGWLLATTYVLGLLGAGQVSGQSILRALVVLAVVELLVYQARYQWNDVRGFVADQNHPAASRRGRLPGPLNEARAHVAASCAVAAAKLVLTGLLIVLLPQLHLSGVLAFAVVAVFGVAIAYEVLRSTSTGEGGALPAPVRPGIVLLWFVVGAGYAVRGMVGLALAVDLSRRPMLAVAAVVALWCYGIAFVTSRWAIEGTAFATVHDGGVTWTARADQAREHLLALVRWLPARIAQPGTDIGDWAPLKEHTPLSAPWNLATIGAGAAAALSGRLLCGACSVRQGLLVAVLGGLATAAVVWAAGRRGPMIVTTALLLLGVLTVLHVPRSILAGLPWLVLMCAYLSSTTRTARELDRANVFGHFARRMGAAAGRLFLGASTWQALQTRGERRQERLAWTTSQRSS
jgi:hypothetical protein